VQFVVRVAIEDLTGPRGGVAARMIIVIAEGCSQLQPTGLRDHVQPTTAAAPREWARSSAQPGFLAAGHQESPLRVLCHAGGVAAALAHEPRALVQAPGERLEPARSDIGSRHLQFAVRIECFAARFRIRCRAVAGFRGQDGHSARIAVTPALESPDLWLPNPCLVSRRRVTGHAKGVKRKLSPRF
jgi:hypothetical protein